jgi:aldehyde:ferredoxin oxidoreductase
MPKGAAPLSPEAIIIINTGPLNATTAPSTSRFNMTFKHVLSGGIATANCGGNFGTMLKKAGIDGLIIKGKAKTPSRIVIAGSDPQSLTIEILAADDLWGLDTEQTQERLPQKHGKFVIGPAGENLVAYAGVVSGERIAARCGGGAVFGSKNLKAITAYGTGKVHIEDEEKFKAYIKKWIAFTKNHPMTGEALPRYGSAGLVNKANTNLAIPTHNFSCGHDEHADAVSGETLAETRLTKNKGCLSCPIRCERRVMVQKEPTSNVTSPLSNVILREVAGSTAAIGGEKDKEIKGPEYETLGLFGPNIDNADLGLIIRINYLCDKLGIDTISCAGTIAFAMELKEKGMADLGVKFGNAKDLLTVIEQIAKRSTPQADELANGSAWLAEKYGGKEFAITAKKLELAAYEPRRSVGMGLGYATSNRGGCHLGGGYVALMESVGVLSIKPQSPHKAPLTVFMQNALDAVSSAGCCLFSAQTFVPSILYKFGPNSPLTRAIGTIAAHAGPAVRLLVRFAPILRFNSMYLLPHAKALSLASGVKFHFGSFLRAGERGFNAEREFSVREGLTGKDDTLPERLTKIPQDPKDQTTKVPLEKMLPKYYKTRGWTKEGIPTQKTLKRLGITP